MTAFEHEQRRYDNAEPEWVHDTKEAPTSEELEDEAKDIVSNILCYYSDSNDFQTCYDNLKDAFAEYFEKRKEVNW